MLSRKMFRDIKANLSQFITIFFMVVIGVAAYTGIEAYMEGMTKTADRFYSENNLFDLQALGQNFSSADLETARALPHVKAAERKLQLNATTNHDHTLFLNFIETNQISRFYVLSGEAFTAGKSGVWLDEDYAHNNHIKVGDLIEIRHSDFKLNERVNGIINVPDHLYDTKDVSELVPNRDENGFAYLSITELPKPLHVFNSLMLDLDDPIHKDLVKDELEQKIKSIFMVLRREDIPSYAAYQGEIDEGKTYVGVFSSLFIFIALLSVVTTMLRLIKKQRSEIGIMKALGFSNTKIIFHYLGYGFWTALFGVIVGLVLGFYSIGKFFMLMQMNLFEIPNGEPIMHQSSYLVGLLVIFCILIVTFIASISILKENPAETLRYKIPSIKKGSIKLAKSFLFQKLNFTTKWNLRDILRNKIRTLTGIVGVASCAMLIITALGMLNSMNHFTKIQFDNMMNFRYKLTLKKHVTPADLADLTSKYGNATSASFKVEIKENDKKISNSIFVTDAGDKLRFINGSDENIKIDRHDGVFVTRKLAQTRAYKIGDEINWHIVGDPTYYKSSIVGFNKDPQNQNITMTAEYFKSLGLSYQPQHIYTNSDLATNISPAIDLVQDRDGLKRSMNFMLSAIYSMMKLIIAVAVLLGATIIYNLGILSFTEKQYQFATLKVLGFSDQKIRRIFIKQKNWIAVISIALGLPSGFYLVDWLFKTAIEEQYDFSAFIEPSSFIVAAVGTYLVSYIVSKLISRKVKSINMVASLKKNE